MGVGIEGKRLFLSEHHIESECEIVLAKGWGEEFADFVTDASNALVVLSNPYFKIDTITSNGTQIVGNGVSKVDPDILRREGVQMRCKGYVRAQSIWVPATVDFEIATYIPYKRVRVESYYVRAFGIQSYSLFNIWAGWQFNFLEEEKDYASLEVGYRIPSRLAGMVGLPPQKEEAQKEADDATGISGQKIVAEFRKERAQRLI